MGFLSAIGNWLKPAVKTVRKIAEKVDNWLNGPSISEEYGELTRKFPIQPLNREKNTAASPDFYSSVQFQEMNSRIGEFEKTLEKQKQNQSIVNKTLALQTDVMRLSICAGAFDRYTNNIKLHASNLSIHLQTIRNVKGLTDDVNSLRSGTYATIRTINHMANLINSSGIGKVNKIENIDIDVEHGSISLGAAYGAFEKTREFLVDEIVSLSNLSEQHLEDVRLVQEKSTELGKFGQEIIQFLDENIVPKLIQAKKIGLYLKNEIEALPVIPKVDRDIDDDVSKAKYPS